MGRIRNAWQALTGNTWDDTRNPVAILEPEPIVEKGISAPDFYWMDLDELKNKGSASSTTAMVRAYIGWAYVCGSLVAQSSAAVPLRMYIAKRSRGTKTPNVPTRSIDKATADELLTRPHLQRWGRKAENEDIEEITEHPFLDVLDMANSEENGFDLKYRAFMFLGLVGDSYWYLLKSGLGVPSEIWTRMPQNMRKFASKGFLQRTTRYLYQRKGDNTKYPLKPEEVVHFQQPSPLSLMKGYGNLAACALSADIDTGMLEYEKALLENQARPDYAIMFKGEMSDAVRKRFKVSLKNTFGGHKKSGGLPIVMEGDGDVKPLGFSPKEMAFLQGHKVIRDRVCAAYHVPISMVATDSVNRSNADTGRGTFAENAIVPLLTLMEGKINERIMPVYGDQVFVAFDSPVGEDQEDKRKWQELYLKTGVLTVNDVRTTEGLEPVDWGDVPLMPMTMMPLGAERPEAVPPEASSPTNDEPDKGMKRSRRTRYRDDMIERERGARKLRPIISGYFFALEAHVLSLLRKGVKGPLDTWTIGLATWNKRFATRFAPMYKALIAVDGRRKMNELPVVGVSFDVESEALTKHVQTYVPKLAGKINGTVIADLKAALQAGIAEGEGSRELRKRIEVIFSSRTKAGAMSIARTESARAQMVATQEAFKQSGVVTAKVWLTAGDPCDWCAPLEGKTLSLTEAYFEQGDEQTVTSSDSGKPLTRTYDYEDVEHPPLHPNCRCTIVEEIR